MTPAQLLASMNDVQKREFLAGIIGGLDPAFKQAMINELARDLSVGEVTIMISADKDSVRVDFGRALAYMRMPKANAIQIAMQILQAAGAKIEPPGTRGPSDEGVIDIKP